MGAKRPVEGALCRQEVKKEQRPEAGAGVCAPGPHGGGEAQRDRKAADQVKTKHSLLDKGPCFSSVFTQCVESAARTETGKILSLEEYLRP